MKMFVLKMVVALMGIILLSSKPAVSFAKTVEVKNGNSISKISSQATSGDTILIHAGTYKEQVNVNKPLKLQPFGDGRVVIDGECQRNHGFDITSANTHIKGLLIKKTIQASILIEKLSTKNVSIDNNTLQDFNCKDNKKLQNYGGVTSYFAGSGIKITGNTITHRVELPGPQRSQDDCIWFKSDDQRPSGGGHYIANNRITGCRDGIGGEAEHSDRGSFDKDTVIENNVIKDCDDDGIQSEGGDVNITIQNNTISGCLIGIAFASNRVGPMHIQNNSISADASNHGKACYKVGQPGNGTTYLTNNDCQAINGADGVKETDPNVAPIVSRNNNYNTSRYIFELGNTPRAGTSFDQDCFSTSSKGQFIKWGGTRYKNLADFQKGTGQEKNGVVSTSCPKRGAGTINVSSINNPSPQTNMPSSQTGAVLPATSNNSSPQQTNLLLNVFNQFLKFFR